MEWKVKNALSRDVEREHLNKILKEISAAIGSSSSGGGLTEQQVVALIQRHAGGGSSSPTRITLSGDVTGSGTSSIPTTINPALLGIGEAPVDSLSYWRAGGQWQAVPGTITSLNNVFGDGIVAHLDDEGWVLREIEGTAGQIVVTDGDGVGNPTVSLADVTIASGGGLKKVGFDSKGRLAEESPATTDDLPVGSTNLYWEEAPSDGKQYVRKDEAWSEVVSGGGGSGVLPLVTGEVPPVFVYADDGSLIYAPASY